MSFRNLARVSASGLFAAGALAVAATPALAADTVDFGLNLKGTTIALNSTGKPATVSIANDGTTTPKEVRVLFDATDLGPEVSINLGDCTFTGGIADCVIDEQFIPGPGKTSDLPVPLKVEGDQRGNIGKLKITVAVEGDTNAANDSKTVDVVLSEKSGADLRVLAHDVTAATATGVLTGQPLQPGARSLAVGEIANHGDVPVNNLRIEIKLPKDLKFAAKYEGCEYNSALTVTTCSGGDELVLTPADQGGDLTGFGIDFEVALAATAKGPASIKGGSWKVVGTAITPAAAQRKAKPVAKLPAFAKAITDAEIDKLDVDPSDNVDEFSVIVAAAPAGVGGGEGTGGGTGGTGGDDDDPTLPVTGPVAMTAAGAGAAALAVGAFLFVSARRRRIGFVTPTDGK